MPFKTALRKTALALALASLSATAELVLKGTCDSPNLSYQTGQTATFSLNLYEDGKAVRPERLAITFMADFGWKQEKVITPDSNRPVTVSATLRKPGVLRLVATACDPAGKPLPRTPRSWGEKNTVTFDGGAVFNLLDIRQDGTEPHDFDAFWKQQVKRLDAVPLKVLEMKELPAPHSDRDIIAYDVKLSSIGPKPVSGILAMPRNARKRSLRAIAEFQGYGVRSAYVSRNYAKDNIVFNVNAHGILNCQPQDYYQTLARQELAQYGIPRESNAIPQDSYYCTMLLRACRAIDFLKTIPQWDGKRLMTSGHSQGGFQAIACAALHPDVNECYGDMPWLANLEGQKTGRLKGWYPPWTEAFRYFDTVNFAKRLRGTLKLNTGLGDYTCTPHSVICIFNHANVPTTLTIWQDVSHNNRHDNCTQHATFTR